MMNENARLYHIIAPIFTDNNKWKLSIGLLGTWFTFLLLNLFVIAFYIVVPLAFYLVGGLIRLGILRTIGGSLSEKHFIERVIFDVLLSIVTTTIMTLLLNTLFLINSLFTIVVFSVIILFLAMLVARTSKSTENDTEELIESSFTKGQEYVIIGILSFGLLFVLFRLIIYPWPTIAGTDTFSHLAAINQIIHDQGTDNIIGGYSYVFHTIIATLSLLSGANPLFVMNHIISFIYPLSLLLSFLLLFYITKNTVISVFSTILTLFVYEHGGYLATYFPFPSTFAFIFLYTSFVACFILPSTKVNTTLIFSLVAITILMYPAAIFVSIPLFLYLLVRERHLPSRLSILYKVVFGGIVIGGLSLILIYYVILPLLMIPSPVIQISSAIILTDNLDSALLHLTMAYSTLQILLIIVGLVFSWLKTRGFNSNRIPSMKTINFGLIAMLGTSYFVILFIPMKYVHRTELYLRPVYILLIVIVVYITAVKISELIHSTNRIQSRKSISVIVIMVVLLVPISFEKATPQVLYLTQGGLRNPSLDEMNAFTWIANLTSPGDYILTDVATGFIMRGVVFRNASTAFTIDGESKSPLSFTDLVQKIFEFLNSTEENLNETVNAILGDADFQRYASSIAYVLISPRTNRWLSQAREGNLIRSAPYRNDINKTTDPSWVKFNCSFFTPVFTSGEVRVFQFTVTPLLYMALNTENRLTYFSNQLNAPLS